MKQVPGRKKRRRQSPSSVLLTVLGIIAISSVLCLGLYAMILLVPALLVGLVVFLSREVVASRNAAHHWREKWPNVQSTEKAVVSLLRGSEEPAIQQKQELLRAAKGQETVTEELLRASQGEQP